MKFYLHEDRPPKQLQVIFSSDIINEMDNIEYLNQNNAEGLSEWYQYIESIKNWLSNPSIAWDYANRFAKFPNGARFIRDFNCNIGYTVKTNQYGAYVFVFMINLKPQEFGLNTIKENKSIYTDNTMKTNKKVIRLTEADLHNMITEAVKTALNEIGDSPRGAYDLGRLYGRHQKRTVSYNSPSEKDIQRRRDFEEYMDNKKFDDPSLRRAFDRGNVNQRRAMETMFGPEYKKRAWKDMVNDRDNADNLDSSFGGREFRDDWNYKR